MEGEKAGAERPSPHNRPGESAAQPGRASCHVPPRMGSLVPPANTSCKRVTCLVLQEQRRSWGQCSGAPQRSGGSSLAWFCGENVGRVTAPGPVQPVLSSPSSSSGILEAPGLQGSRGNPLLQPTSPSVARPPHVFSRELEARGQDRCGVAGISWGSKLQSRSGVRVVPWHFSPMWIPTRHT